MVRHAGWVASLVLVALAQALCSSPTTTLAFALVAVDAICSDLLQLGRWSSRGEQFFCGNFGLLLLDAASAANVLPALSTMLRVTCMRGAQSAGLVTYVSKAEYKVGQRHRVVNGGGSDGLNLMPSLTLMRVA